MTEQTTLNGGAILELKGSHFAAEGMAGAMTMRLFPDHVETTQRVGLHHESRSIGLEHVTSLEARAGKGSWETLVIITDEGDHIEVPGLGHDSIGEAITAIEMASKGATHDGVDEPMSVADQLRHLNMLRAEGTISEEEFSRRKNELFAS